jgi:hypothetical protein
MMKVAMSQRRILLDLDPIRIDTHSDITNCVSSAAVSFENREFPSRDQAVKPMLALGLP